MKKLLPIIPFIFIFIIIGCSSDNIDKPAPTTSLIIQTPEININDSPLSFELPSYSKDKAIKIPYPNPLPENVELLYNDEYATILTYTCALGESGTRRPDQVMTSRGISDGKMIYREDDGLKHYRYGYLNIDFSRLTDAIYTRVYPFENGNAVVRRETGYGVIDIDGIEVIPCALGRQPTFMKNIIRVPNDNDGNTSTYHCYNRKTGEYEYMMKEVYDSDTGHYLYYREYADGKEEPMDITEELIESGLELYRDEGGKFGYKDVFGDIAIPPEYWYAHDFSEGFAGVRNSRLWGYINELGELVIPYRYDSVTDFNDGVALVTLEGKETYIMANGEQLNDMDFSIRKSYNEGIAAVIPKGGTKWRYIDEDGNYAFPGEFIRAGNFSHGYAPVLDKNYRNYFIDTEGKPAFAGMLFEYAQEINENGYSLSEIRTAVQVWDELWRGYATVSANKYFMIIIKERP